MVGPEVPTHVQTHTKPEREVEGKTQDRDAKVYSGGSAMKNSPQTNVFRFRRHRKGELVSEHPFGYCRMI